MFTVRRVIPVPAEETLRHMSDYDLLRRVNLDRERPNRRDPDFPLLAECVRRGIAESPVRRLEIESTGPRLSRAERYITLAFQEINGCSAYTEEDRRKYAGWQESLSRIVRGIRKWATDVGTWIE